MYSFIKYVNWQNFIQQINCYSHSIGSKFQTKAKYFTY